MKKTSKILLGNYTLWSLIIILIIALSWGYFSYTRRLDRARQVQIDRVKEQAALIAAALDGLSLQSIKSKADFESAAYQTLQNRIGHLQQQLNMTDGMIKILRQKGSMTEIILDDVRHNHIGANFDLWKEMTAAAQGKPAGRILDEHGRTMAVGIAAIRDMGGKTTALLLLQKDIGNLLPPVQESFLWPLIAGLLGFILLFIAAKLIMGKLNRGIDFIYRNLNRLKEGQLLEKKDSSLSLSEIYPSLKDLEQSMAGSKESELEREKVQKQMTEFLKIVNAAADGDFTVSADVSAGTFGALADSFNLMISDLSGLIRDVKKAAEQVASSTGGILTNIEAMAKGAEEQATQIETMSNFSKDMAKLVNDTNLSAQRAAEAAQAAREVAERGSDMVKKSISGMQNIRNSVREASKQVRQLGENSTRIGEITDFISEIASRTNLLALNASIEAARAGEAGRGFSVVADEIRNLAERSSTSAEEISKLTASIQSGISRTMEAMENGNHQVADGTKLVDSAGEVLRDIVGKVEISTKSSIEISTATEEQTRFSREIVASLEHIAGIAKETAEGAKQSTQAATQLEALSGTLNRAVQKFRLAQ